MHGNLKEKEKSIEQATAAVYKIQKTIDSLNNQKTAIIDKKQRLEKLEEQYQHIVNETCPTCMRQWDGGDGATKEDLEAKINTLKTDVKKYKEDIAEMPHHTMLLKKAQEILEKRKTAIVNEELQGKLLKLEEIKRKLENEKENIISSKRNEYLEVFNDWSAKYSAVTEVYREKVSEIEEGIKNAENDLRNIKVVQESYQRELDTYNKDVANLNREIKNARDKRKETIKELEEINKNIVLSEESIRLIKNYTLQKFQDTLDYIGQRATEIINMVPNMANAVIYFENAKETKSGKIKNEVNAVINLEGDTGVPIKTLSGGERTSADFAIDLAVGEMIESMTQKGVNFLIIDEGFDGLDSISKIECLEILKNLNTDKKILIVDHSSEVKEMVYDIIQVNRVNEESYVV